MTPSNAQSSRHAGTPAKLGKTVINGGYALAHKCLTRSKGTMLEIDDIANTLALFTFELPDSNEELSVQQWLLDKFTLFPKLPLELRLIIWKAALPRGRLVSLGIEAAILIFRSRRGRARFPTTLYVNQESRRETLLHYEIFHPQDFPNRLFRKRGRARAICISPTRDYIYFHKICMGSVLGQLVKRYPSSINKICSLAVEFYQSDNPLEFHRAVSMFGGLRKLYIIQPEYDELEVSTKDWEDGKTRYLEKMKGLQTKESERSVPEVKIIPSQAVCRQIWWDN